MSAVLTQGERVLARLREGPQDTLALRAEYIMAVGYVIFRLRAEGHVIHTTLLPNKVARYTLVREAS